MKSCNIRCVCGSDCAYGVLCPCECDSEAECCCESCGVRCVCGENCVYGALCECDCTSYEACNCEACGVYCGCGKLSCNFGPGCECICENESVCNCVVCKFTSETTKDSRGNITSYTLSDGEKEMTETSVYHSTIDKPISTVDSNGNIVYYVYDDESGLLETQTIESENPNYNDSVINYSYISTSVDLLSNISQTVSGLSNGSTIASAYEYNEKELAETITRNGFTYYFDYDEAGNTTAVSVGTQALGEYTYNSDGNKTSTGFGNGDMNIYTYENGNITSISYGNGNDINVVFSYTYDTDGNLLTATDVVNGQTLTYNENGYVITDTSNNIVYSRTKNETDKTVTEIINGTTYVTAFNDPAYSYQTGQVTNTSSISFSGNTIQRNCVIDQFERQKSNGFTHSYPNNAKTISGHVDLGYNDTATTVGTEINSYESSISNGTDENESKFNYEYDNRGNITEIYDSTNPGQNIPLYSYEYDEASQLVRENNAVLNKTYIYSYDIGGNIVSKTVYPYTTTSELGTSINTVPYIYDSVWKDKLTYFNGNQIIYDEIGNPLTYNGIEYTWFGRDLLKYDLDDDIVEYKYNSAGLRTSKHVEIGNDVVDYDYTWTDNGILTGYKYSTSNETFSVWIMYGENGDAIGFTVDDEYVFYFIKNLQGDVIRITNDEGETLVEYKYDAWGNMTLSLGSGCVDPLAIIAIMLNPFTYRGYMFDMETNMYYLQSRYYNPEWGRFLNSDTYIDTRDGVLSTNVFAYCQNDPVKNKDPKGTLLNATELNDTLDLIESQFAELGFPFMGALMAKLFYGTVLRTIYSNAWTILWDQGIFYRDGYYLPHIARTLKEKVDFDVVEANLIDGFEKMNFVFSSSVGIYLSTYFDTRTCGEWAEYIAKHGLNFFAGLFYGLLDIQDTELYVQPCDLSRVLL